jgi:hypothetical protein
VTESTKAPPFQRRRTGHPKFKIKGRATRPKVDPVDLVLQVIAVGYGTSDPREKDVRTNADALGLIGMAVRNPELFISTLNAERARTAFRAWAYVGAAFLGEFLSEIRSHICDDKKIPADIKDITKVSMGALAAYLVSAFHVPSTYSIALAMFIALVVLKATRGAFCKVTDQEVLLALGHKEPIVRKKRRVKSPTKSRKR